MGYSRDIFLLQCIVQIKEALQLLKKKKFFTLVCKLDQSLEDDYFKCFLLYCLSTTQTPNDTQSHTHTPSHTHKIFKIENIRNFLLKEED